MIDFDTSYSALQRRDPSLDGVVFAAVKTTGIYCRPVCRVRTPLARNVVFYPSAAAAERAGYRPCFRCRPETAPFCPAWKGTRTTVERALVLIETGVLDKDSVAALAARLGIGARHLSRLFADHLDASPVQVAQSLRIQRAKRLLDETDLPISVIAERAGFRSPTSDDRRIHSGLPAEAIHICQGKTQLRQQPTCAACSGRQWFSVCTIIKPEGNRCRNVLRARAMGP